MIEVKNLVKKYGSHLAVDSLSFTVEQGQIYGFLGPNGAGKSTTMNIMTGYIGATSGEVLINGHDILKEPELAKKSIGYLPEIPPLYTDMTVMEYLKFAAELKRIPKKEITEAVDEVIQMVQLEDVKLRLIKNLSKGYKQRVGLAQAILGFPEIIILDEPMVGLDPKQIIEIRELIRELAKNHTVILSSHILAEVREVCDHIMIISKGKLVASDTPENLEKLMDKTETITLEVEAEQAVVEQVLESMEKEMTWEISVADEGVVLVVIKTQEEDLRKELSRALALADCQLLTLKRETASLEDIFLELTETEPEDVSDEELVDDEDVDIDYTEDEVYAEEECDKDVDVQEEYVEEQEEMEDESDL